MTLSLKSLTLAFGLMASTSTAQEYFIDQETYIDMEGYFSQEHSTPYVSIITHNENWALDWQTIRTFLENDSEVFSRPVLIEACQMLKAFKQEQVHLFDEMNIDPQTTLPPDWYDCNNPPLLGFVTDRQPTLSS
jgi:hypothetical protein